ncbi:MAG TPA: two-component regulator propeller domain-containing protein, partial [Terriglobales bacterium]
MLMLKDVQQSGGSAQMHAKATFRRTLALLVLAASCACALQPSRALSRYGRASWNTENGLPQNTVHKVLQSSDGFIWIATDGGVARFDGVDFTIFDKRSAARLPDEHVRDILEDRAGAIWAATAKGVVRIQRHDAQVFTIEHGLPSDDVSALALDAEGTVYAVTANGVARFADAKFMPVNGASADINYSTHDRTDAVLVGTPKGIDRIARGSVEHIVDASDVRSIAVTDRGEIWFASRSGIQVFARGKLEAVTIPESVARSAQTLSSAGSDVWVGSTNGVSHIDAQRRVTSFDAQSGLPSNNVTALYADRSGTIWIGTARGIARFAAGRVEAISPREGFAANSITSFLEDREGSLWIATETSGLALLRDRNFVTYTTRDGLADDNITSLTQDASGTVWLGSNGGGLSAMRNGTFSTYSSAHGIASDFVLSLAADKNGGVWVGTPDGLNALRAGHTQLYSTADGLADDFVRSVLVARDGAVWVGTRRGLSELRNGAWRTYTTADGLPNNYVGVLVQDRDASLWIGTLGGLSHLQSGKFTNYTSELSSNAVTALHQDADGDLWIGTSGGGFDLLRGGALSQPKNDGRLPDVIFG